MATPAERFREGMPVHYFDCDRFCIYDYGTRQGECDCTANEDAEAVLAELTPEPANEDCPWCKGEGMENAAAWWGGPCETCGGSGRVASSEGGRAL